MVASCGPIRKPHKFWGQDVRGQYFWEGVEGIYDLNPFQSKFLWTKTCMQSWDISQASVKDQRQSRISFP